MSVREIDTDNKPESAKPSSRWVGAAEVHVPRDALGELAG